MGFEEGFSKFAAAADEVGDAGFEGIVGVVVAVVDCL